MADKYFNARINPGLAFKAIVGRGYLFPVTGRQRQTAQDMHRVVIIYSTQYMEWQTLPRY